MSTARTLPSGRGLKTFRSLGSLAAATAVLTLAADVSAQDSSPRPVTLKSAADGLPIAATYYPADAGRVTGGLKNAAVVILLHGSNEDRLVWEKKPTIFDKPFAKVLSEDGFAVLTIDLRGHGESPLPSGKSVRNNDYRDMLGDIEAGKRFLMEQHEAGQLNINKLGIVAAGDSAALAVNYAKYDWEKPDYDDAPTPARRTPRGRDVRALVLFSPSPMAGPVRTLSGVNFIRNPRLNIATLVSYGEDDPEDDGLSERIGNQLRADNVPDDGYIVMKYPGRFRGTDLMGDPGRKTELHAENFLKKFLAELPSEWVERRSRLDR